MQPAYCHNCKNVFENDQKFCDQCGQSTTFHRFTVAHVFHEFFHAFTHADSGIIYLAKELAKNPGRVASEYVGGRLKKYFPPFSFLLICVGFFVLVNNVIKTYPDTPPPDPNIVKSLPTAEARKNYIGMMERTAAGTKAMNKHANIITVIAMPLYASIMWLFFRRRKRNFAEILIAMVFFTAFANLCTTVFFNPFLAWYKGTSTYVYIFLILSVLQSLYYAWGFHYFFYYRSVGAFIKIWLAILLTFIIWIIFTMFVFMFYIYGNKTFAVFGALWDAYLKK